MKDLKDDFPVLLMRYMNRQGLDAPALAKKIGVRRETVWHWLSGHIKRPKIETVFKCAQALQLTHTEQTALLRSADYPVDTTPPPSPRIPMKQRNFIDNAPFTPITTRPILDPQHFFGRSQLLEDAFTAWSRSVFEHIAIIGEKRSGKTSFLYHLMHKQTATTLRATQQSHWLNQDYRWVFIDFCYVEALKQQKLLVYILTTLDLPVPENCDLDHFIETIEENLTSPAIILMDDIEFGLESAELNQAFWNTLRHLANSPAGKQIGFCVTSRQSPAQLEARAIELGKPSPFFNTFDSKLLGAFTEDEAQEFLACMQVSTSDAAWIIDNLGTWPVVLQKSCKIRLNALKDTQQDWQHACLALREEYAYLWS